MTRLDQLAKPFRRNGEHICAILERERRQAMELENLSKISLSHSSPASQDKRKSRSMSQLNGRIKSRDSSRNSRNRLISPLHRNAKNAETTKSMTQLSGNNDKKSLSTSATPSKSGWINALITKKKKIPYWHKRTIYRYNLELDAGFRCNALSHLFNSTFYYTYLLDIYGYLFGIETIKRVH